MGGIDGWRRRRRAAATLSLFSPSLSRTGSKDHTSTAASWRVSAPRPAMKSVKTAGLASRGSQRLRVVAAMVVVCGGGGGAVRGPGGPCEVYAAARPRPATLPRRRPSPRRTPPLTPSHARDRPGAGRAIRRRHRIRFCGACQGTRGLSVPSDEARPSPHSPPLPTRAAAPPQVRVCGRGVAPAGRRARRVGAASARPPHQGPPSRGRRDGLPPAPGLSRGAGMHIDPTLSPLSGAFAAMDAPPPAPPPADDDDPLYQSDDFRMYCFKVRGESGVAWGSGREGRRAWEGGGDAGSRKPLGQRRGGRPPGASIAPPARRSRPGRASWKDAEGGKSAPAPPLPPPRAFVAEIFCYPAPRFSWAYPNRAHPFTPFSGPALLQTVSAGCFCGLGGGGRWRMRGGGRRRRPANPPSLLPPPPCTATPTPGKPAPTRTRASAPGAATRAAPSTTPASRART